MTRGARLLPVLCGWLALLAPPLLLAQTAPAKPAPGEVRIPAQPPLLQQQRAGAAYNELQKASQEAKQAGQDLLRTQENYNATRNRAEALKAELDKAIQVRDAA
jgi:hypothetical protein